MRQGTSKSFSVNLCHEISSEHETPVDSTFGSSMSFDSISSSFSMTIWMRVRFQTKLVYFVLQLPISTMRFSTGEPILFSINHKPVLAFNSQPTDKSNFRLKLCFVRLQSLELQKFSIFLHSGS